ncbi:MULTISPECIES: YebC/PmpR family DNA-binding transcriptional regulator [Syntrophotalea]|jgi:YebC/PmpR family DNA-binding regulatory protein|uniref:Probable transcriptional regulatory protein A7E75_09725 n=1 Tax=Syntrophotalea acetylenica TaxID=29542 RepID=A0A1L3GH88_SYNAC|nr:YebC/PmpR family DNA-binding transcriptional regulator [Syntrophotalea acetylenica]APG25259.1 transcriptional regulator [Syntrophotalea acetylenica]APG43328.1 transcriptional regulator [Syntrophotalea acetylenica]MDY0263020.1 YebC/PmpR family DNA-binding transcriptional regulator [Syntrophotalea acetylenica]
MAGHSKWANIKHRKGAQDAKRGKIFTKLIKEITVAAKIGGGDLEANARLRTAVDKAKGSNMPKDTIERAIKKGCGDLDGVNYEEGTFEGYGPGGVAVIVEFMTDNRTRTVADVRHIFNKHNGSLGVNGSVAFLFDRKGLISFDTEQDFDALFETALEAGAEDVKDEGDAYEIITDPADFMEVRDALAAKGLQWQTAEVTMIPQTMVGLEGKQAEQMLKMMDKLEDNDDVQNVYANFDISDEEIARIME